MHLPCIQSPGCRWENQLRTLCQRLEAGQAGFILDALFAARPARFEEQAHPGACPLPPSHVLVEGSRISQAGDIVQKETSTKETGLGDWEALNPDCSFFSGSLKFLASIHDKFDLEII